VTALLAHTDDLLRGGPLTTRPARPRRLLLRLLAIATVGGLIYGGVMGAYGGVAHGRAWQMVYSAVKVPLLLLATFALSLPSFFVLNQLLGVGRDFPVVLRGLVATQAALQVVLASLAPLTALWYATSADYGTALAANMVAFTVAAVAAQAVLQRWYRPLVARNPRHRTLLRTWLLVYAFVGIQIGWTLRPFIGNPGGPPRFLRDPAWGNAYVEVGRILLGLARRM
jgi:hypothetical protein